MPTITLTKRERKRRSCQMALYNSYSWVFNQASEAQKAAYASWYPTAHAACSLLSYHTNTHVTTAAATVAALSPGTRWEDNLRAAWGALNRDWETAWAYHSYGSVGVDRAKTIVQNNLTNESAKRIVSQGQSWKTQSFYDSLLLTPESACIDTWIYRINRLGYLSESPPRGYIQAAQSAIAMIATEQSMPTYAVQSILWGTWRRIKNQPSYPDAIDIVRSVLHS